VYFKVSFRFTVEGRNVIILLILLYYNRLFNRIGLSFKPNLKANIRGQNMRKVIDIQMKFGEVDISKIEFDLQCRDEIPKLLIGLQEIYCNPKVRGEVFNVLLDLIPEGIDPNNGRKGMDLWKILVLGTLHYGFAAIGIMTN
jgi:hypothetical protein